MVQFLPITKITKEVLIVHVHFMEQVKAAFLSAMTSKTVLQKSTKFRISL